MDLSNLPPLSMLRAFEAAARCGGLSAAGRELNVTHAAIGQQIKKLEARLGVMLARREGRGLALTPEGRRLADRLSDGFATFKSALDELGAAAESAPVKISLTPMFSAYWLAPRIGAFREAHPMIELMLHPSADLVDLIGEGFDFGIRFGAGPEVWPGVDGEQLVATHHVIAAAPTLLRGSPVRTPEDLLALPWIQETGTDEWRVWLSSRGVSVEGKRDVLHMPGFMAVGAIRAGQGVGLVARALVERDLAAGELVALFDDADADTPKGRQMGYYLVWPKGTLRAQAQAVVAWLRREAARDAAKEIAP